MPPGSEPPAPEIEKELGPGHGPGRNTILSLASQMAGAVFTLTLTLFLVRKLGATEFGVLALAVSVGTIALIVSDLGISISASRFVAENPEDRLHAAAILRTGFLLKLAASLVATVILFVLAPVFADAFGSSALTWPLRVIALSVAAQNLGAIFSEWFTGLGRIALNFRFALVESSVELTTTLCLVLLGAGATGAAAGRALGYTAAGILAAFFAVRLVGWRAIRAAGKAPFPARPILTYGSALLVVDGAFVLFDRADIIIIGALIGSTAAGIFEGAARILTFLFYPGIAVGAGYGPRLAIGRRTERDVADFMGALRYCILLYILLSVPTVIWADPIVNLFLGPGFAESAEVLRVVGATLVLAGIAPVLAGAANFLGAARRRIPIAIAALLVNTVIDLLLVPSLGVVAGGIGTGVAMIVYTGGHLLICRQELGVPFSPLAVSLARALVAAVVAAGILVPFGTHDLGVAEWILGSVLASTAYVGTLLVLRELTIEDVTRLATHIPLFSRQSDASQ
jgi:O-antigen/teichoic acid export membrane protein